MKYRFRIQKPNIFNFCRYEKLPPKLILKSISRIIWGQFFDLGYLFIIWGKIKGFFGVTLNLFPTEI